MKLTILLALGTALVTLAQKPTLEPQKDWSKERTQLWLDSLVKSLSQETKILGNTTQNLSEKPPAGTMTQAEVDAINKIELEKQQAENYRKSKQAVEEAEYIFEGYGLYGTQEEDDGMYPMPFYFKGKKYETCRVQITRIYKGEKDLKLGTVQVVTEGSLEFDPNIISHINIRPKTIDKRVNMFFLCNKNTVSVINKGNTNNKTLFMFDYLTGGDMQSLSLSLADPKQTMIGGLSGVGFKTRNDFYDFIGYNKRNIKEDSIFNKRTIMFYKMYLRNKQHKIDSIQKKTFNQNPLRIEVTQSVETITGIFPLKIRAGLNEQLTIIGSGFGNSSLSSGFIKGILFPNADSYIGTNNLPFYTTGTDPSNYIYWSDTKIIIKIPSSISPEYGLQGVQNTPGSGRILIQSESGTFLTSSQELDIEYSLLNFRSSTAAGANTSREYI